MTTKIPAFLLTLSLFFGSLAAQAEIPLTPTRKLNIMNTQVAIYESSGTQGPGILMIHGNTSSSNTFARILNSSFAQYYRVVAVDLPGYGKSGNFTIYNTAKFRDVIKNVAIQTQTANGVLVGWSWGGDLALQASTVLPNLKGVFTFGTAPIGGAPQGAPSPLLTPFESPAGLATLYGVIPTLLPFQIRAYVDAFFAPGFSPIPNTFYQDGYRTDPRTRLVVAAAGTGLDFTFKPEVTIARNLTIPFAMVHLEKDSFVRLAYLRAIESSFPTLWTGQTVVVPNAGHALQWEDPSTFINLLNSFITDLP